MANRDDRNTSDDIDPVGKKGAHRVLGEEIEEGVIENAGHPTGGESGGRGDVLMGDLPPNTDPQREQHARKGQAESPRELTPNQPEKKHVPGGRG